MNSSSPEHLGITGETVENAVVRLVTGRKLDVAEVIDGNFLRLVEKFLSTGVQTNRVFKLITVGTPHGGVVFPQLAKIVLDHLDWQMHAAVYRFNSRTHKQTYPHT